MKAQRTEETFVLAFIDVDGLKATNDSQGHGAGDEVLRLVVAALRRSLREYDLIVRYGGDEFLCGLSDLNPDEADSRLAATRERLASTGMSFSFGLAPLGGPETLRELIARADLAMYEQRRDRASDKGTHW